MTAELQFKPFSQSVHSRSLNICWVCRRNWNAKKKRNT